MDNVLDLDIGRVESHFAAHVPEVGWVETDGVEYPGSSEIMIIDISAGAISTGFSNAAEPLCSTSVNLGFDLCHNVMLGGEGAVLTLFASWV